MIHFLILRNGIFPNGFLPRGALSGQRFVVRSSPQGLAAEPEQFVYEIPIFKKIKRCGYTQFILTGIDPQWIHSPRKDDIQMVRQARTLHIASSHGHV